MSNITVSFTWEEYYNSDTARAKGINNIPPKGQKTKIEKAALNLFTSTVQPVRNLLDKPMIISSGYSNSELNKWLVRKDTSQHSLGEAIDFVVPNFSNLAAARLIAKSGITFDQLIFERRKRPNGTHYDWVHLSCKLDASQNRREVLYSPVTGSYVQGLPNA